MKKTRLIRREEFNTFNAMQNLNIKEVDRIVWFFFYKQTSR